MVVHPESHTLTPPGAGVHNGWRDAGVSSPKLRAVFGVNLTSALSSLGYLAVALFVGIESIGVPLPGETMLITAAAYAGATHALNIVAVIAVAAAAAIVVVAGRHDQSAVATSAGLGVPITIAGALGYMLAGLPHQAEMPPLSIGFVSFIGVAVMAPISSFSAPYGARLAHALPGRSLEIGFGIFLMLVSARFLVSLVG